jgi:hypothetical protein
MGDAIWELGAGVTTLDTDRNYVIRYEMLRLPPLF